MNCSVTLDFESLNDLVRALEVTQYLHTVCTDMSVCYKMSLVASLSASH